jgi:hypothetical protein
MVVRLAITALEGIAAALACWRLSMAAIALGERFGRRRRTPLQQPATLPVACPRRFAPLQRPERLARVRIARRRSAHWRPAPRRTA